MFQFAEEILQLSPRRLQFDDSFEDLKTLRRNYAKDIILASGKMTQYVGSTVAVVFVSME